MVPPQLSGQLRRSDMFIVPASKQNRLKPHRGGMVRSGEDHAAPTELERSIGGTVTINMSLLRSWPEQSSIFTLSSKDPMPKPKGVKAGGPYREAEIGKAEVGPRTTDHETKGEKLKP